MVGESSQSGAAPGSVVAGGLIAVPGLREIMVVLHGDFPEDSPCLDLPTSGMHGRLLEET